MNKQILGLLCLIAVCGIASAEEIPTPATIATEAQASPENWQTIDRYQVKGGLVNDTRTGLMWMRCSIGQEWDGTTCQGVPKEFSWHTTMKSFKKLSYGGFVGWRVPTVQELKTLVYCSTGQPAQWNTAINEAEYDGCGGEFDIPTIMNQVFPATPATWVWSSTPNINNDKRAWVVNFGKGSSPPSGNKDGAIPVRLVRNDELAPTAGAQQAAPAPITPTEQTPTENKPTPDNIQLQQEHEELEKYKAKDELDEANKRINVVWNATTKTVRETLLPEQRQWLKQRENDCKAKASAEEASNMILQETIKLHCMAAMTDPRTEELKQKIALLTNPPQSEPAPIATATNINNTATQENSSAQITAEKENTGTVYIVIAGLLLLIIYVKAQLRKKAKAKREKQKEYINMKVDSIINTHIKALALKKKQLTTTDSYGNLFYKKWFKERDHFVDHVLKKDESIRVHLDLDNRIINSPLVTDNTFNKTLERIKEARLISNEEILNKIEHAILVEQLTNHNHVVDADKLTPIEFENYCADILRSNGWRARVTQASGDQGIDVIAEYGNTKAVFQCKKYSNPVGNKAVQEAFAGKGFEQADIAVVVTNATYTPSAKQLANTTGVYLLHYSELSDFADKITLT